MFNVDLENTGASDLNFTQHPEPTKPALGRPPNIIKLKLRPPMSPEETERKRKLSQDKIKDKKKRKHSGDKQSPTSERSPQAAALSESSVLLFS
jgi:hypothetical protein